MTWMSWLRDQFRRPENTQFPVGAHMTEAEARRLAESWATENKKYWMTPATAAFKVDEGRRIWLVQSNAHGKGHSILVTIDDATGQVLGHHEYPR
jgi:hypothetical protein